MIYLSESDRLAIIAGCLSFLLVCFLIMVCKLSPHCCLNKYCPLRPKYDQEHTLGPDIEKVRHYESTFDPGVPPLYSPQIQRWRHIHYPPTSESSSEDGYSTVEEDKDQVSDLKPRPTKKRRKPFIFSSSESSPDDEAYSWLVKGEVEINMFYTEDDPAHLKVGINRVTKLVIRKRDKVKLCIKIQLLKEETSLERVLKFFQFLDPDEQDKIIEYETYSTLKSVDKELEWEELKSIPLVRSASRNRCVRFVCCLFDRYSQCTQIGDTLVPVREVTLTEGEVIHRQFRATIQECKGELLLSLSYLPTSQKLVVKPIECRQLKLIETDHKSSTFIRVALVSKGSYTKKKTKQKQSETRISWNEPMNFELPGVQLAEVSLMLTVKQSIQYADRPRDKTLGKMVIGLVMGTLKAQNQWKKMLQAPREPQSEWHSIY